MLGVGFRGCGLLDVGVVGVEGAGSKGRAWTWGEL